MAEHAKYFQASSAARWMACPGSVKLCDGLPDEGSAYAEEGTLAHDIASRVLLGETPDTDSLSEEMFECVVGYVERTKAEAEGHVLLIEQRVEFSEAIGQSGSFGTLDAAIIAGDTIKLRDFKTGMIKVSPLPQLGLYALGLLETYPMLGPFTRVQMTIDQPRLGHLETVEMTMAELHAFAAEARAAAAEAMSDNPRFNPTDKGCRFCRAKAHCPALAAHVEEVVGSKFDDLDAEEIEQGPERMGTNYLAHCMSAVSLVEDWCKGIRARVERELLAGNTIDGWKLVQGRKGARKWASEQEAEATLKKMKLKVEEMYDFKVISPTTAEKLAKAGTIGPRQWPALQALITQSEGGLSVAPASDKRPAASVTAKAEDFADLTN
jgi:hypothetical protein